MKFRTASPEETRSLASALASVLGRGDLVLLVGDLGSGKTVFAQGLAAGLGVREPVTSPTFTIVQEYEGRHPVAHVDVYRLDRVQDLYDLGFDELVEGRGVTIVEWGDLVARAMPRDHVVVQIEPGDDDAERVLDMTFNGPRWRERMAAVESALEARAR